ncbi:ABC transporter permease [Fusibacter sp. 3D3]|uniref:ABC transporter permease n=1 Tax=Fusibacter sp. 3D3 TaxID=1048380 RepID=UPI0008535AE5|nr:ABC transporter permease [Fusibacter sp. 3D3]GAU79254.1 ABC-type multidrug transport system permease component [Fusibacter sp. 3D3]
MTPFIVELKKFFSVPKNLVFMILGPLALTLFFGYVFSNDYVNGIPIAVCDMDGSALSRSVSELFSNDDRYEIIYYTHDLESIKELVDTKQVYMGLVIPKNFQKDMKSKKGTTAALMVDGTNIAIANNAVATASEILNTINAGVNIQFLSGKGTPERLSENYVKLFAFNTRILWDQKLSYRYYIMPGMVLVLIQQLFLSVFVINYIKDQENVILKALIHIVTGMFSYRICLLLLNEILNVKLLGHVGIATAILGVYLVCLTGMGMTIGALTRNSLRATQFCMMMSLPTFLTAGYVWPMFKMPAITTWIVKLFWPLIYMVSPLRDYLIKGSFPAEFRNGFIQLLVFGAFWLMMGRWISKKRLLTKEA